MFRISNFQIFCILMILVGPIAYLEIPKRLAILTFNNAWIAALATIIPGILVILMFKYIIDKSQNPFPLLLEEYLGKVGSRILAGIYVIVFLFIVSFTLSVFVNFIVTNVLPDVPISVLIGSFLFLSYVIIKNGLENLARLCELIVFVGLPFSFGIVFLATSQTIDIRNLLPIGRISMNDFGLAVLSATSVLGRLFPILTIAYFSNYRPKVARTLYWVLGLYIMLIFSATLVTTLVYGSVASTLLTFPVFSVLRLIRIGDFLTNLDIFFIGIWVAGIIGTLTFYWFMACFTTQQMFNLEGYRFIAAPTSLIIAIVSLLISPNIVVLNIINENFIVFVYFIFLILIPALLFILALFKPDQPIKTSNDSNDSPAIM